MAEEGLFSHRLKGFKTALNPRDIPGTALDLAGEAAGLLGDVIAAPIEAMTPQPVLDYLSDVVGEGVARYGGTDLGKAIKQQIKENPKEARHLMSAANILGIGPLAKMLTKSAKGSIQGAVKNKDKGVKAQAKAALFGGLPDFMSSLARNMDTHQRGGRTFGDPVDAFNNIKNKISPKEGAKVRSFKEIATGRNKFLGSGVNFYQNPILATLGEAIDAAPATLMESVRPGLLARNEATGRAYRSWNEARRLKEDRDNLGRSGTELMQRQMAEGINKKPAPLAPYGSPLDVDQRVGEPLDLHKEGLAVKKRILKGVPAVIATEHLRHLREVWGIDPSETTMMHTIRAGKDSAAMEASGAKRTSGTLLSGWEDGSLWKTYKEVTGVKDMSAKDVIESTQVAGAVTKENRMKLKDHFDHGESSFIAKFSTLAGEKIPTKNQTVLPSGKLIKVLLSARHKEANGIKLGKQEQKYLDGWEAIGNPVMQLKDYSGNIISSKTVNGIKEPVGSMITGQGSFLSQGKERGGVNYKFTTDMNAKDTAGNSVVRSTISNSDVSDLASYPGPKGSDNLLIAVEAQTISHGTRKKSKAVRKNWGITESKTLAEKKESMRIMKEAFGEDYNPNVEVFNDGKTQHRALLEQARPTPQRRHYSKALTNARDQGLFAFQADTRKEEK